MPRQRNPVSAPEGTVLKPLDKDGIPDDNEWPSFLLYDAVVYRADGVTMANALLVKTDGPYIVRGRLEIDDEEDVQYLVRPEVRSAYIQVERNTKYSIGCNADNSSAIIWVSGDSGWFEIVPHPFYEPIYRDMCFVALLYYQLMSIYENATQDMPAKAARVVRRTLDIKTVLFDYAVAMGNGTTYDETVDTCLRLGPALLQHLESDKDYAWNQTSFYLWLAKELKDRESSKGPSTTPGPVTQARSSPAALPGVAATPQSAPMSQALPFRAQTQTKAGEPSTPTPATRGASGNPASEQHRLDLEEACAPTPGTPQPGSLCVPIPAVASGPEWDNYRENLFQILLAAVRDIGQTFVASTGKPITSASQSSINGKLYNYFRLRKYVMSKALSAFFRDELEAALGPDWKGGPFVNWLHSEEAATLQPSSTELFLRSLAVQLVRRTPANTHPSKEGKTPGSGNTSREGSARPTAGKRAVLRLPGSTAQKRLFSESGLEASTSDSAAHAPKALRRDKNGRFVVEIDDDDGGNVDDIGAVVAEDVGQSSQPEANDDGKGSEIAPPKPMVVDLDTSESSSSSSNSSSSSSEDDDDDTEDFQDNTTLVIRSVPLMQSLQPTGPNRTWRCPEPDCPFFVRGVESDLSDDDDDDDDDDGEDEDEDEDEVDYDGPSTTRRARAQVRAHMRSHEGQSLDRMGLAIREGWRKQVSVNHLLDKIRSLAEANQQPPVPTTSSIVRQFLV